MFRLSIPTVHLLIEMGDEQAIEIYDKYGEFMDSPSIDNIEISYSTGLLDNNGQEVFEGDILKDDEGEFMGLVIFDEGFAKFMFKSVTYEELGSLYKLEIIGNRYENP